MDPMSGFEALGAHVARRLDEQAPDDGETARIRDGFLRRVNPTAPRRKPRAALGGIAAAALLALVVTLVLVRRGTEPPLSFYVGSIPEPGELGRWVSAPMGGPVSIRFSDGSRAVLAPEARGRVAQVRAHGADIVVERGLVTIDVVPSKANDFRVNAGPFVVHVTGTRFGLQWRAERDELWLEMDEGRVLVSGCKFGAPGRAVVAGETLRASCAEGEIAGRDEPVLRTTMPASAPEPEPAQQAGHAVNRGTVGAQQALVAARSPVANPVEAPSWKDLAGDGRYADAYAAAQRPGFASECATAGASDLIVLGDVARLSGHVADASFAYRGVRARFAGSPSAATAAFWLARIDFDRGDHAASARWLSTYLTEAPNGGLAPAAQGRLIEARHRAGDAAGARRAAQRYLALYPDGPHARTAREALGAQAFAP